MTGREEANQKIYRLIQGLAERYPVIDGFYRYMKVASLEDRTCLDYCYIVTQFLKETGVDYRTATPVDVTNYLFSHQKGDKPQTQLNLMWYGLNKFYKYLVTIGEVETNIMQSIDKPRPKSSQDVKRTFLSPEECKAFLKAIDEKNKDRYGFQNLRDQALFRVLMETGVRISAIVNANIEDFDKERHVLRVTDKGNKTTEYALSDFSFNDVCVWITHRVYVMQPYNPNYPSEPLFITRRRKRMNTTEIYDLTKTYGKMIGREDIHPHSFRASFATNLYNETKDIAFVQRSMNHAKINTTQLYIQDDDVSHERAASIMCGLLK